MVDAAYYHAGYGQTYFFSGRRYARVKFRPNHDDDEVTFGPAKITSYWPSLVSIGFGTVDTILPVEGSPDEGYYFFGARFARIRLVPETNNDTVTDGPWVITQKLTSLATAGFDTVDAAMPVPGKSGEAYIFRGTNYVRININTDKIVYGPSSLKSAWSNITNAGFDSIDLALPVPGSTNGDTYFFKGDKYLKARVVAGAAETITYGPKPIADHWKSLDWA
ncbi:Hemopexin [Aspergillus lucknowensis]|uniref:Hemopexin n=1 Tax=Aspergillus lucknowensis TaxID=176173 RepID=A0ABR4LZC7_9EURO